MTEDIDWRDMPVLRKTGRYAFFALCAIGNNGLAYVALRLAFDNREVANTVASIVALVTFLALRDMSKQWDWALDQQSKARSEGRAQ
jgi:uncharacterized membrane protein YeiH